MRVAIVFVVLLGLSGLAAGCTGSPVGATTGAAFSQLDLRAGTGATAAASSTVVVNYTGWLYDATQAGQKGIQFDSSLGSTTVPSFVLGSTSLIQGWNEGIPGMREGGLRRLIVPPSLGYGALRHGPVPPNATMVFEIELVSVTAPQ